MSGAPAKLTVRKGGPSEKAKRSLLAAHRKFLVATRGSSHALARWAGALTTDAVEIIASDAEARAELLAMVEALRELGVSLSAYADQIENTVLSDGGSETA